MCSVGDDTYDNEEDKVMHSPNISKIYEMCNKCRTEKPCVVLRHKDAYCRNCFLIGTTHKFKASLGKFRLIHPNDKVLIWHQIGNPSTALLHFLRTGLDLTAAKKLRFEPIILFVDDQYHLTLDERKQLLEKVKQECSNLGFPLNCISFAKYIEDSNDLPKLLSDKLEISENDIHILKDVIKKKASKTNKDNIKVILRRQLLLDVAKYYKCKYVFTPEISSDIASTLLSNISIGRGSCISIDTGFCDDRDDQVKILRPLRLFDIKELAFYNRLNDLEPIAVRQKEINPYSSIQNLMKKFVSELQTSYPATVTTVLRTGDKLSLNKNFKMRCKLCLAPLPVIGERLITSEQSTNFSHLVSTEMPDYTLSQQERYQIISEKFDKLIFTNKDICYACSIISDSFINKVSS